MYLVCISGASASGKTALAQLTEQAFLDAGITCQKISMDNYYRPRNDLTDPDPIKFRAETNFDTPEMLRLDLLRDDLLRLDQGLSIVNRKFDFPSNQYGMSDADLITHDPSEVVIIEGLFAALFAKSLPAELAHYIVHVQTNDYLDLLDRRSRRDTRERGRNEAEVLACERKHVGEGFLKFTASSATGSDLYIVNETLPQDLESAAEAIVLAFQTRGHTPIVRQVAKTTQQRVFESHLAAAAMVDRAPCIMLEGQKSFSGIFGETKGLYVAPHQEINAVP